MLTLSEDDVKAMINRNMGCIEMDVFNANEKTFEAINRNMGCIEMVSATDCYQVRSINRNMGCIEIAPYLLHAHALY